MDVKKPNGKIIAEYVRIETAQRPVDAYLNRVKASFT